MVDKKLKTDGDSVVVEGDESVMEVDNHGQQGDTNNETVDDNSDQTTHELTQTDHLNKKLLEAFLSRINTTHDSNQAVVDNNQDDSQEWVDKTT